MTTTYTTDYNGSISTTASVGPKVDREQYVICKQRSHEAADYGVTVGSTSWSFCKHCGTQYRFQVTEELIEI